ncbi:MAG: zeta toxin family protein [Chloroflexi bacterium]|nr:zeta toxin family protein [Chloroflexota bacterium]
MGNEKRILIIAGPNGAGKTVFATEFLPNEANCPTFINADMIAAGISPFRPHAASVGAGRLMLNMMREYVKRGESFAFETTLSGRGYVRSIHNWQELGYRVELIFLRLGTPEMAIERVRQRVLEGGHDVPEDVIRRRFEAGWHNFQTIYGDLVDHWKLYENSSGKPFLIKEGENR